MHSGLEISCDLRISAIYYALWQSGYEYSGYERSEQHLDALKLAADNGQQLAFFDKVRQRTCEVYPFWPRAALLEKASYYLCDEGNRYADFERLRRDIMAAPNVSDVERNGAFWAWLEDFPSALREVMHSDGFQRYLAWEQEWIRKQNICHKAELDRISECLNICREKYNSPVRRMQLVVNPIKCVYSSDYHFVGDTFVFCSGRLQEASVIHEFLHHVVHPVVISHQKEILLDQRKYTDIDASYYNAGRLNAFEEYLVRCLTQDAQAMNLPESIDGYLRTNLK